jgi:hypothetical protein
MKKDRIPYRNKSPYGWWLATCLERFEFYDEDKSNSNRRCIAWENTILIKAKDREEAYGKAVENGKLSDGSEADFNGRKGTWVFEGLTSLIPIYEELEDGAEILWDEHKNCAVKTVKSWVRTKGELEAFTD